MSETPHAAPDDQQPAAHEPFADPTQAPGMPEGIYRDPVQPAEAADPAPKLRDRLQGWFSRFGVGAHRPESEPEPEPEVVPEDETPTIIIEGFRRSEREPEQQPTPSSPKPSVPRRTPRRPTPAGRSAAPSQAGRQQAPRPTRSASLATDSRNNPRTQSGERNSPSGEDGQLPPIPQDQPLTLGRLSLHDLVETYDDVMISKAERLDKQNEAWRQQAFDALQGYAREAAHILGGNPEYVNRMVTMRLTDTETMKFKPARLRNPSIVNTFVTNDTQKNGRMTWRQEKGFSPSGADLKASSKGVEVWIVNGWEETIPNPTLPRYLPEASPASVQESKRVRHPSTPNNPYTDPHTKPAKNGWAIDAEGKIYQFYNGGNLIPVTQFEQAVAASGEAMPGTKETRVDNGRADFERLDRNWANHFARIIAEHRR